MVMKPTIFQRKQLPRRYYNDTGRYTLVVVNYGYRVRHAIKIMVGACAFITKYLWPKNGVLGYRFPPGASLIISRTYVRKKKF